MWLTVGIQRVTDLREDVEILKLVIGFAMLFQTEFKSIVLREISRNRA